MNLSTKDIFDFIADCWGITKIDIGSELGIIPTRLSERTYRCNTDNVFKKFFDVKGTESFASGEPADKIRNALKYFLIERAKISDDLSDIWDDPDYDNAIKTILKRANIQAYRKTDSKTSKPKQPKKHVDENDFKICKKENNIDQLSIDYESSRSKQPVMVIKYNPDGLLDKPRLLNFITSSKTFQEFYDREISYLKSVEKQNREYDEESIAQGLRKLEAMFYANKK